MRGVKGLTNAITVANRGAPLGDIKTNIEAALTRRSRAMATSTASLGCASVSSTHLGGEIGPGLAKIAAQFEVRLAGVAMNALGSFVRCSITSSGIVVSLRRATASLP